ncbi:MAG: sulfatase-like hydrolase/transferase [Phycisphaerae bacterium]
MFGLSRLTGRLKRWAQKQLRNMVSRLAPLVGLRLARLLAAAGMLLALQASAQGQTNVVLFQVDDLGWSQNSLPYSRHYAAMRGDTDTLFETPNLEAMGRDGVVFQNAYCPSPVCSPSRMSLVTGQNPADHHMTQYIKQDWADLYETDDFILNIPDSTTTLAEVFQDGGYRTAHMGKWHLGDDGTPAADPLNHGFDVNIGGGRAGKPNTYFADSTGSFALPNLGPGSSQPGEYLPDRLARAATDFISDAAADNQPFFLLMNHYAVHTPIDAKAVDVAHFRQKLDDNAYANFDALSSGEKDDVATYAAMMYSVDQSLGAIREQLTASGLAGDTVVVFLSDNGGLSTSAGNFDAPAIMNSPLQSGKGHMYEGGLRGPMVVAGPGISGAMTTDALVTNSDLYPTLIELAGLDPATGNQNIDGQSFVDVLNGTDTDGRDSVIFHYPHTSNNYEPPQIPQPFSAIRSGDWKLMEIYHPDGTTDIELYNITSDIGETTNLAGDNPQLVGQLRTTMRDYLRSVDAGMPTGHDLNDPIDPPDSSVLVNFYTSGVDSPIALAGMNNIDQHGSGGGTMARVDGQLSVISITMNEPFGSDSTNNDPSDAFSLGDDNPFDLNGIDPSQTHINGRYDSTGTDPDADGIGSLVIAGLDTAHRAVTYDMFVWASRSGGSETDQTLYEIIGAETVDGVSSNSFVVRDNETVLVEFTGISEFNGDGSIELLVENLSATGAIVLNALRIDEVVEYVPGDANLDLRVDLADASILLSAWQSAGAWQEGDFNGDGLVDQEDAALLLGNWGYGMTDPASAPASLTAVVPEPGTLVFLGLGGIGLIGRRRQSAQRLS